MGSVRKASAWLGLVDDSDDERYYDDDYAEGSEPGDSWMTDPRARAADETSQDHGTRIATVTRTGSGMPAASARCSGRAFRSSSTSRRWSRPTPSAWWTSWPG
ncbi:hypothetical protein GCM10017744_075520 [Streptomyces antimycoticus]